MSGLGDHGYAVRDRDRWTTGRRQPLPSPRCRKPMTRYEAANGPMVDQPECGRPENHNGRCRSGAALARKYAADIARIAAVRQVEGKRYGRPSVSPAGTEGLAA